MRVLFTAHLYPPRHNAGAEWMVHTMLRSLVDRGHRVTVLLSRPTPDGDYLLDGVQVLAHRGADDLWRHLRGADLVLTHLENTPRTVVAARVAGVPFGIVCHNDRPHTKAWLVSDAALVVLNSEWMARDCGLRPRGLVVRPPVLADEYRTDPGDRVTLVNLNESKGGLVLAALANRMPDVAFLAVRGAYGEQVTSKSPNVEVIAHVPGHEMAGQVYARTRVLLMPSDYESWGRVGVEAMCSGIPVVAHPTPGLVESLGAAGTFVHRDDLDGWEAAIRRLLVDEPHWAHRSELACKRVAELDPAGDLAAFVEAVEATVGGAV